MTTSNRVARTVRQRRRKRVQRQHNAPRVMRWVGCSLLTLLVSITLITTLGAGSMVGMYAHYARQLPPADSIVSAQADAFQTTVFYERTGQRSIYEVIDPFGGDRQYAEIEDLPPYVLQSTIAIEDASFYENPGFNVRGLVRAMVTNLAGGEVQQGGSSITQQLVKNTLIPADERDDPSVDRKIKELILANELSRLYSKDQILEWYLNTNFYGNLAYGIEAASRVYFDKPARDLSLAEAAVLAAIPQNPNLNPIDNPVEARQRQQIVIETMVEEGYITRLQADDALSQPMIIKPFTKRFQITAPHFSLYAKNEAEAILNELGYDGDRLISRGGLRIYTTLDLDLQQQLECTAQSHVDRLASADPNLVNNTSEGTSCIAAQYLHPPSQAITAQQRNVSNAAGVILRANTGEIIAMLGSVDFWDQGIQGQYNGVLALRQPASTFKPFVYVTAFINPIDANTVVTPATMTYDVLTEFDNGQVEPYIPQNIDRQFHGPISVRKALANSYNVPVVQVLSWVGLNPVIRTAHIMGINSMNAGLSNYGLSLALGTAEASLLDMTYAYNVFNNLGVMVGTPVFSSQAVPGYRQLNPTSILRIEDSEGNVLWDYSQERGTFDRRVILEAGMAYLITDILSDNEARVEAFGRNSVLQLSRPAAVKTGTSDDSRDSWAIGYTPQYTMGVWMGNNDARPMDGITGQEGATPIWNAMMEYAHARDRLPVEEWARPTTITEQNVCQYSGLLPTVNCPQVTEIFYYDPVLGIDYRPNRVDGLWTTLRVNTCNNTLATAYSPTACIADKTYFQFPSEVVAWAKAAPGIELPPTEFDQSGSESIFSPVVINTPSFLEQVSGIYEILGNVSDDTMDYFFLEVGAGSPPETWQKIGSNQELGGSGIRLASWDTRRLDDGLYTLRLTMVRQDGSPEISVREVIVDNTAPSVRLIEPLTNKRYSQQRDVFLELVAEAADNNQISYVEFYANDELLGTATEGPYTYRWEIVNTDSVELWAVVVDVAGNKTEGQHIQVGLEP